MSARVPRRDGVALFAALGLMAVVGLLIGGTLASVTLARRATTAAHTDARLTTVAEFAVASMLGERASEVADVPFGRATVFDVASGIDGVRATVAATRLPTDVVWLVAEVESPFARRRVNVVARWRPIMRAPSAPIVARGNVRVASGVVVESDSSSDAECRALPSAPQVLVGPGSVVVSDGLHSTIDSLAADSATFLATAAQRAALDTLRPILRVRGDTTLSGGSFEGILVVDGALIVSGTVSITGLLVASGSIDAREGRLLVRGAVLSFAPPEIGRFAVNVGAGVIRYSACEIARMWRRSLPLSSVRARSWAEII
jgi:hypothetical protein